MYNTISDARSGSFTFSNADAYHTLKQMDLRRANICGSFDFKRNVPSSFFVLLKTVAVAFVKQLGRGPSKCIHT